MTLIKCSECGTEISDKAAACVRCGAPVARKVASAPAAPKKKSGCLPVIGAAFVICVAIAMCTSNSNKGASESQSKPEAACAKDDLSCLGNKGVVAAGVYCPDQIERLATHSVKWTDGTFEMKFSRFRWADKQAGTITYIGDRAQFQNGFGAYTNVVYECDLAADGKTVLDARVSEGRLPAN